MFPLSLSAVHPCETKGKGGCEQICNKHGKKFTCSCVAPLWTLEKDGKSCKKVHPCDKPNKGGCSQICNKKPMGEEEEEEEEEEEDKPFTCSCKPGFRLQEDGVSCVKVHPCDMNNGGCNQKCVKEGKKAACRCKKDFKLEDDGKTCVKGNPSSSSLIFVVIFT